MYPLREYKQEVLEFTNLKLCNSHQCIANIEIYKSASYRRFQIEMTIIL